METKNFNEYIENIYEDGWVEGFGDGLNNGFDHAVDVIGGLHCEACDVTMDILEDMGMTMSERLFAAHVLEMYSDIFGEFVADEFSDCDGDCENCGMNSEEELSHE